jgi:hypothetical protein
MENNWGNFYFILFLPRKYYLLQVLLKNLQLDSFVDLPKGTDLIRQQYNKLFL